MKLCRGQKATIVTMLLVMGGSLLFPPIDRSVLGVGRYRGLPSRTYILDRETAAIWACGPGGCRLLEPPYPFHEPWWAGEWFVIGTLSLSSFVLTGRWARRAT